MKYKLLIYILGFALFASCSQSKSSSQKVDSAIVNNQNLVISQGSPLKAEFKEIASIKGQPLTNAWVDDEGIYFSKGDLGRGVIHYLSFIDSKVTDVALQDSLYKQVPTSNLEEYMNLETKSLAVFTSDKETGPQIYIYSLQKNGDNFSVKKMKLLNGEFKSISPWGSTSDARYIFFKADGIFHYLDISTGKIQILLGLKNPAIDGQIMDNLNFVPNSHKIVAMVLKNGRFTYRIWDMDQNASLYELPDVRRSDSVSISEKSLTYRDEEKSEVLFVNLKTLVSKRASYVLPTKDISEVKFGVSSGGNYFLLDFMKFRDAWSQYSRNTTITNLSNNDKYDFDLPYEPLYNNPGFLYTGAVEDLMSPDERWILGEYGWKPNTLNFFNLNNKGLVTTFNDFFSSKLFTCKQTCYADLRKVEYSSDSTFVLLNYEFGDSYIEGDYVLPAPQPRRRRPMGNASQIVDVLTGELLLETSTSYEKNSSDPKTKYYFISGRKLAIREWNNIIVYSY